MKTLFLLFVNLLFASVCFSQNYSLLFDGVDDYCITTKVAAVSNNFTIEFWANPSAVDSVVIEGGQPLGFSMVLHPTHGQLNWGAGHAGVGVTVATNVITVCEHSSDYTKSSLVWEGAISGWNHIAVIYENKTPKLYVNGILVRTGLTSNYTVHPSLGYDSYPGYNNMCGIGAGFGGGAVYKGSLDELRISDIVRYNNNFIPQNYFDNDVNTIGLYHFDEGAGIIIYDNSGNNNDGTINGATWSTDVPPGLTQGLVAYYPFNGNANDETGNGYNGINYGGTLTADRFGDPNKAYSFDGVNDYIDLSNTENLNFTTGGFSLAVWINYTQDKEMVFLAKHTWQEIKGYGFSTAPSPKIGFYLHMDPTMGIITDESYNDGNWHFVVGTYNNSMMKLFVDGQLKGTLSRNYSEFNTTTIKIGKFSSNPDPTFCFNGKIDDIRIFNRELSASEILYLYSEGTGIFPDWHANITVADAGGLDASNILTFGQDSTATDSIDAALGEYELPPLPPTGIFDTRFNLPTTPAIGSFSDYRNINDISIVWTMTFQPSLSGYPFTFTWSSDSLPQIGTFFLKDFFGLVNINMRTQNSYTLTNPAINSLKIEYEKTFTKDVNIQSGWNMLSVPVDASDMRASTLFPGATSYFFGYNNGYQIEDTLKNSKGYWAKFGSSQTYQITGNLVYPPDIAAINGWNIIGPFDFDISVSNITSTPPNIVATNFFGFNTGYQIADTLKVGKGYWVRVNQSGTLNLSGLEKNLIKKDLAEDALVEINFTVYDGAGGSTLLKAGVDTTGTDGLDSLLGEYEVPPLPPTGIFDARFNLPSSTISTVTDIRQGTLSGGFNRLHEMQYQVGAGSSININYNFGTYSPDQVKARFQDVVTGTLIDTTVYGSGSYSVPNPSVFNKLKLTMIYGTSIPVELTSFSASSIDKDINLQWTTATETNNSGFSIERKNKNENSWNTVSFVNGRGTATELTNYTYTDKNVPAGNYNYRLKQIDFDGSYEYSNIVEVEVSLPKTFSLGNCYPNPFNPLTRIKYQIPQKEFVSIKVFDVIGNEISTLINHEQSGGIYEVVFDASNLPSGIYFYQLKAGSFAQTRKMILLK